MVAVVAVPTLIAVGFAHVGAPVPPDVSKKPAVPVALKDVVLGAVWYGIDPAVPPVSAVAVDAGVPTTHVNVVPSQLST